MLQTFDFVNDDMSGWFTDLQKQKKVPSGLPVDSTIKVETIHLNKEQFVQFLKNPDSFVRFDTSPNAANSVIDPLYG